MRLEAAVGGVVWATLLCSGVLGHENAHGLHRRHHDLHVLMKRVPTPTVNLVKRGDVFNAPSWPTVSIPAGFTLAGGVEITPVAQMAVSAVTGSSALASAMAAATPAVDPATWNKEATQNCQDAVNKLNGLSSSNTGMVACYNVPFLDQNKGTFESELRIYNVSLATGVFAGVSQAMMMVQMTYPSATFQEYSGTLPSKRDLVNRQASGANGVFAAQLISTKTYVGQINPASFNSGMSTAQFKALLTPNITIYANIPATNRNISSELSSDEASFNAGLFTSGSGSLTDPKFLLNNPAEKIIAAQQGLPTPFIVPGLSLGVFPTGLIVTSLWMLAFFSTVAYGTMGRIKFRDQYRRDMKAYQTSGIRRI